VATPDQVKALLDEITPRYRAAVALGAWCGLRRGEVIGLMRDDFRIVFAEDESGRLVPVNAEVTVRRSRVELLESRVAFDGPPKTDAGHRAVTIPPHVIPYLVEHLDKYAGPERVFVGRDGKPMRGDAIRQAHARARKRLVEQNKIPENLRFHDLRHTGQTLAAATGATLKDLMLRLGHATPVAANRYLHAVQGRDAEIALALSQLAAHGNAAKLPKTIVVKN